MTCGAIQEDGKLKCPHCNDGYKILVDDDNPDGPIKTPCSICHGKGRINWVDLIVPTSGGFSGYSGFSGYYSTQGGAGGYSGISGYVGYCGISGCSGYSNQPAGSLFYDTQKNNINISTGDGNWVEL
jgi:DNA-directed RNA polymerase subunit RPC12/RpoP